MNGVSSKVAAGGVTGAITGVLIWIASLFGLEIPTEVGVYISTILAFVVAYLVPETRSIPLEQAKINQVVSTDTNKDKEPTSL